MEESKGGPNSHVQEVGYEKRKAGFGAKLKAHLRKWWWLHLIFFIASTLIIVLCLVYVGFPRISQNGVNDSTLEIQSLTFSDPTPDSFRLQQDALLTNHNTYHPRLDAFNASLSVGGSEDKPYAYVELPPVHATEEATTHVDQEVKITDADSFADYTTQLLTKESVDLLVKGLNGLAGFNVTSFTIKLTPDPDGTNMEGTVYIPNPSVMTISMGNVTFNNYVDNVFIGISSLSDLVLKPGNNTVPMRSTVNQTFVIEKVVGTYKDGMLPVDIVGNSSVYDGQHLGYFEKALSSNRQHIILNVGAALAAAGAGGLIG
ncbi:MAG: hypothetical protein Q9220_006628 [cf. Caloplaca sp. 1 TL-2023]